ncbi:hypothetical protein [Salinibacter grassmerensis]|uniref:hypothetical protein n=1 Tax=Salinibacter grassmerensis TaxID=3040353 RepID=UPI0021E85B37|nr:hypothetical protein [Salinibacter grassmerensis]
MADLSKINNIEDVDWENFDSVYTEDEAKSLNRQFAQDPGKEHLSQEQRRKLYEKRHESRGYKDYPESQDHIMIPDGKGGKQPVKRCTATTQNTGKRCRNPARNGFDTCRMHGGGTKENPPVQDYLKPIYKIQEDSDNELQEKMERFLNDERLDSIEDEMALQKAVQQNLLERFDDAENVTEETLLKVSRDITKTWKAKKDVEANHALTMKEVDKLIEVLKTSLEQHADKDAQRKVINDIKKVFQG